MEGRKRDALISLINKTLILIVCQTKQLRAHLECIAIHYIHPDENRIEFFNRHADSQHLFIYSFSSSNFNKEIIMKFVAKQVDLLESIFWMNIISQ